MTSVPEGSDIRIVGRIDLTPTWRDILPALIHVLRATDSVKAIDSASEELCRMALAADRYQALVKLAEVDATDHERRTPHSVREALEKVSEALK